ncbi:MAG: flagellar basal-body rod protein FlgG [Myxococcota bacterium]|nr:flagellar basal-body rod protein FlgG [Myxococcales bacterium]
MRALFTAATGMNAQQARMDAIANNLANVNTTGFKRANAEFQDLFYETLAAPGAPTGDGSALPGGVQIGHGVKLASVVRDFAHGERVRTDRPLDLAIEGDGFLQVQKPGGETLYTVAGALQLDRDGNIVTQEGYPILPSITVPPDAQDLTIARDGTVSVTQPGAATATAIGQIQLARFVNPSGLRALGSNLYAPTEASGDPETGTPDADGFGSIAQGFLEASNVNVAEELVKMILAQRGFEMNSRVIQAGDEMMQTVGAMSR